MGLSLIMQLDAMSSFKLQKKIPAVLCISPQMNKPCMEPPQISGHLEEKRRVDSQPLAILYIRFEGDCLWTSLRQAIKSVITDSPKIQYSGVTKTF